MKMPKITPVVFQVPATAELPQTTSPDCASVYTQSSCAAANCVAVGVMVATLRPLTRQTRKKAC